MTEKEISMNLCEDPEIPLTKSQIYLETVSAGLQSSYMLTQHKVESISQQVWREEIITIQ